MATITRTAEQFFEACETGQGWDGCGGFCTPDATFAAQAEPLAGVKSLREYTEWMKGLLTFMPDGRYEVQSFATDEQRGNVCAYGVFSATHTGPGGPLPPTGKRTTTDYVYSHAVRRRENPPHDENLERTLGDERARVGLMPGDNHRRRCVSGKPS